MSFASRIFAVASASLVVTSCAGPSWEQVRSQDTPAGYRRYVADHPRSSHAAEAAERLAILQFENDPNPEALERFRREHPDSAEFPALLARIETRSFDAARADGTVDAYERFLATFPDGAHAARARGNLAFLQAGGLAGRADALAAFLHDHPESDFAVEARRSLGALETRRVASFAPIEMRIEIAPSVPDSDRLRSLFAARAREIYADAGVTTTDGEGGATLLIRHAERSVGADEAGDVLARPGVLAETEVTLSGPSGAPVFQHRFSWRVVGSDMRAGSSALLARASSAFWERFFVPVATWPTSAAKRAEWSGGGPLTGVGAELGRAIALAPDGGFREIDLADPAQPRVAGQYVRSGPPARFSGAHQLAGRVATFGEDGLEIVVRQNGKYRRIAGFDRGVVGAVVGVEVVDDRILVAGTRGLLRLPIDGGTVERLIERPLRGIARVDDTMYMLDEHWLYAGPVGDLRATNFFTAAELGRGFEPRLLRTDGSLGVVVGSGGAAVFALSSDGAARPLARLRASSVGTIADAAVLGGGVFLLGERGLLVVDPSTGRIVDSVDVDASSALGAAGSYLVAVGGERLEVVDAAPWIARVGPAASIAP